MNNLHVKVWALVLFCLNTSVIVSAIATSVTPPANVGELISEVQNTAPASLQFSQCTLDFSN